MRAWIVAVLALLTACGEDAVGQGEGPVVEVDVAADAGPPAEEAVDAGLDLAPAPDSGPAAGADAGPGDDGDGRPPCPCVPDTIRYCDAPAYCAWGAQICQEDGSWSGCEEESIPPGCDPYGALAESYEWHYAGGYWDGEIDDEDGDGVVTSEPDWWLNPAGQDCAIRAGLCVQDAWDFDVDGDVEESIGNCRVEC
jgi:hypothetical protein